MPRSDRDLMVAFQEGDPTAFEVLYGRYARHLINFFNKMSYDRTLSEDLAQETFLRLVRSKTNYRPEASFKTYLFTVARNLWIDRYRSRKSAPRTVSTDLPVAEEGATVGDLVPALDPAVDKRLQDQEAADLVKEALLDLPEGQRLVFVMAESQGLKYREIAEVLEIPVGTVKSRMNAALTRLRGMLGHVLR